jgi:hypothetical protein
MKITGIDYLRRISTSVKTLMITNTTNPFSTVYLVHKIFLLPMSSLQDPRIKDLGEVSILGA